MIDTKKLRRLAQAATPHVGHACKYQDTHWLREGHVDFENADLFIASERPQEDAAFYAAANPAAISELLDRLEAAEKERDALRSLVVMRFDHDHPPQFVQGYDPHELNEPVTADHCRWFVAEIEQLRAKVAEMEKQEPVAFGLYSGWALKATYLKEHEACEQRDRRQLTADLGGSLEAYRVAPLYALPGAQAQPVPSMPEVTDAMALAFPRALTDGSIGAREVEEIKDALRAALAAAPNQEKDNGSI